MAKIPLELQGVDQAAMATYIVKRWDDMKLDRATKETEWKECRQAYNRQHPDDSEISDFRSQRFLPEIYEGFQRVHSTLAQALMPNDAWPQAEGDNPSAHDTEALRAIYMRKRLRECDFRGEYVDKHLLQLLMYGSAPALVEWQQDITKADPDTKTYMLGSEPKTFHYSPNSFDGPSFRSIDLFEFVCEQGPGSMNSKLKIFRSELTRSKYDAYAKAGLYHKIPDGEPISRDTLVEGQRQEQLLETGVGTTDKPSEDSDKVELLWAHGNITVGGVYFENMIYVIANRRHVAQIRTNPYEHGQSPLVFETLFPVPGDVYGNGLIAPALPWQDMLNIRKNQEVDAYNMTLNNMWVAVEGEVDPDDLVSRPNGVIWVDTLEKELIRRLDMPTQVLMAKGDLHDLRGAVTSAMFDLKDSDSTAGTKTATEIAASSNVMGSVVGRITQRLEEGGLERYLAMFDGLEVQFYDPASDVYVRYEDQGDATFGKITPEVIYNYYTWRAFGSSYTPLKELRRRELVETMMMVLQTPAAAGMDFDETVRAILKDLGRRDTQKLFPGQAAMQQKQMQQGGMGPQGQAPGGGVPGQPGLPPLGRGAIPNQGGGANTVEAIERAMGNAGGL